MSRVKLSEYKFLGDVEWEHVEEYRRQGKGTGMSSFGDQDLESDYLPQGK